jgi:hypothetical protein
VQAAIQAGVPPWRAAERPDELQQTEEDRKAFHLSDSSDDDDDSDASPAFECQVCPLRCLSLLSQYYYPGRAPTPGVGRERVRTVGRVFARGREAVAPLKQQESGAAQPSLASSRL